jgi:cytochrome c peroxidase
MRCGSFIRSARHLTLFVLTLFAAGWAWSSAGGPSVSKEHGDTSLSFANAEVRVGDRLFFETRFSEYFFENNQGDINLAPREGDPVVSEILKATGGVIRGPFRGKAMNCRQCHLGDDLIANSPLLGRTYCDFNRRSLVPVRKDGTISTVRNSPLMPDLMLPRDGPAFFHFDGEFVAVEDLIADTMTGRNFGWLPTETTVARTHIARIIREDNGANARTVIDNTGRGISYRNILLGADPTLPQDLRLPESYQLDVGSSSDEQIIDLIAALIRAYMGSLRFGTDHTFRWSRSPYDVFLEKNRIAASPDKGETPTEYSSRLLGQIKGQNHFIWVTNVDAVYQLHHQAFSFGPDELRGLEIFLTRGNATVRHAGNCSACHTPPRFSDFRFHNDGATQIEYDSIFGVGSFSRLEIPSLRERNSAFDHWLPASSAHPNASGRFRTVTNVNRPGYSDLGVWNILANPDIPKPQEALIHVLCGDVARPSSCNPEALLPRTIGLFKTPTLRDLGQSAPYLHTGSLDTIESVLKFYVHTSTLARSGQLRNASPEIRNIRIDDSDVNLLAAFLRALNEDYH